MIGKTRTKQVGECLNTKKTVFKGEAEYDALSAHHKDCNCDIQWDQSKTIALEPIWFNWKVCKAMEI